MNTVNEVERGWGVYKESWIICVLILENFQILCMFFFYVKSTSVNNLFE